MTLAGQDTTTTTAMVSGDISSESEPILRKRQ